MEQYALLALSGAALLGVTGQYFEIRMLRDRVDFLESRASIHASILKVIADTLEEITNILNIGKSHEQKTH